MVDRRTMDEDYKTASASSSNKVLTENSSKKSRIKRSESGTAGSRKSSNRMQECSLGIN